MSTADCEDYDLQPLILLPSLGHVDISDHNFQKALWIAMDNNREESCTGSIPSFQWSEEGMVFPTIFLKEVSTFAKNDCRFLEPPEDFEVIMAEKEALASEMVPLSIDEMFDNDMSNEDGIEDSEDKYYEDIMKCCEINRKEDIFRKENDSDGRIVTSRLENASQTEGLDGDGISQEKVEECRSEVRQGKKSGPNFTKMQVKYMEEEFTEKKNEKPNSQRFLELSSKIGLQNIQVRNWFNNKRKRSV